MKRRPKLILAVLFALAASTAVTRPGFAESRTRQTAENHYEKGMKAYTLGHFPEAIEEFERAYELRSEPIFLYNIAQSHRQNDNPQRAIFFYRRYLEAAPNAKNRPEIEKRIKDIEALLAAQQTSTPATISPATQPAPAAPQPAPTVAAPVPAQGASMTRRATPESQGRGLRIAGIVTASVGVAAIASGIVFGVHASSLHDDAYSGTYDYNKDQSSKSYETLEWVSFGIGGAALITGGVLYYLGATARNTSLAIAPLLAPGTSGAVVLGRF